MVNKRKLSANFNFLYILIPLLLVLVIMIYPFFLSIYYSFTKWNGFSKAEFIGFQNYFFLLEDYHFPNALKNNALIALAAPFFIIIPLILAVLLFRNQGFLMKTARMSLLLPFALSMTIVGIVFRALMHVTGPINTFLSSIGLNFLAIDWLGSSKFALITIILTALWKDFGFITVVYLTGLSNINQDIIDAGRVDGVNWWQEFIHIIVPQLNAIIVFITALILIGDFKAMFDYVYNMTQGGPGFATETIEFLLYKEGFSYLNMGFACTLGVVIFLIIFIITYFQINIMTRKD